jgi:hypothetical protein
MRGLNTAYRRLFGVSFGLVLGLVYGLISQWINRLDLPGIDLYQPPFGPVGNALFFMIVAALVCIVAAWTGDSLKAVLYGGVLAALILLGYSLTLSTLSEGGLSRTLPATLVITLPVIGFFIPILGIFRWIVDREVLADYDHEPFWKRIWLPLGLLVLVGFLGYTSRFPESGRIEVVRMNALLQEGLHAREAGELPKPLLRPDVGNFSENASPVYTLQLERKNINRFAIPRQMSSRQSETAAVIARFQNSWSLVCLFADRDAEPRCKGFSQADL